MAIYGEQEDNAILVAILTESGLTITAQTLIMKMFQKQQEIIGAMEEMVKLAGWRQQSVDRRLDELLDKIEPEGAENRKASKINAECWSPIRVPGKGLL